MLYVCGFQAYEHLVNVIPGLVDSFAETGHAIIFTIAAAAHDGRDNCFQSRRYLACADERFSGLCQVAHS